MGDFTIHPHAARRWCERVLHIEAPRITERDMTRAYAAIALAMETARSVLRYGGSKRRLFVTTEGVHVLVGPGRFVISVMDPAWVIQGCPCAGCLAKSSQRLRDGEVDHSRHGVLARLHGLNRGHTTARRHKPRQG